MLDSILLIHIIQDFLLSHMSQKQENIFLFFVFLIKCFWQKGEIGHFENVMPIWFSFIDYLILRRKKKGELGYFENVIPHNVFWSNFFFNFLIFGDPHKEAWRVRCSSNSKSLPINVWGRWWGWFILSSHNQKKPKMEINYFHVSITSFMISIFTNWSSGFWMAT